MRQRCTRRSHKRFASYGGRGIRVCERWDSFEAFLSDMGARPEGTSLDRINNDGNYEPANCRWATATAQNNNRRLNRRVAWRGEDKTVTEWSRSTGLTPKLIFDRLYAGWTAEKALTTPARAWKRAA